MTRLRLVALFALCAVLPSLFLRCADAQYASTEWPVAGAGPRGNGRHPNATAGSASFFQKPGIDLLDASRPVIAPDGSVIIATQAGDVICVEPESSGQATRWSVTLPNGVSFTPAISKDNAVGDAGFVVYVSNIEGENGDMKLYALNGKDGAEAWSIVFGSEVTTSPVIAPGGLVVFGTLDGNMFALEPSDGAKVWNQTVGNDIEGITPAISDTGALFGGSNTVSQTGVVFSLDASTGVQN